VQPILFGILALLVGLNYDVRVLDGDETAGGLLCEEPASYTPLTLALQSRS
jgi:hypothetical protein